MKLIGNAILVCKFIPYLQLDIAKGSGALLA